MSNYKPLTTGEVAAIYAEVNFYPNWSFEVYDTDFEGMWIHIVGTNILDSYNLDKTQDLGIRSALPRFFSAEQALDWLADRLIRIASHEVREHLQYVGVRIYDPHQEVSQHLSE